MSESAAVVRSTTWCALLGYAVVASGIPLPFGSLSLDRGAVRVDPDMVRLLAAKDRGRPFPCMDKPCGCATAEQCFRNCCCHTAEERLAWARARGCEAVARAALDRAERVRPAAATSCCAEETACRATQARPPEPAWASGRSRSVTVRAMLACSGMLDQWFAASGALPPARVEAPLPLRCPQRVIVIDAYGDSLRPLPDVPPPRAA